MAVIKSRNEWLSYNLNYQLRAISYTLSVARCQLYFVSILCVVFLAHRPLLRFSYLDREYETLPTANHYTNANQCSSQANSAIHYVTILS